MGILSNVLCIIFIASTALLTSANQNPVLYGLPDCLSSFEDTDSTTTWITGSSTPYNLGYTCGLSETNAVTGEDGSVTLTIDDTASSGYDYSCGEVISGEQTKWGTYTCWMTAQGIAGTIQSCQITTTTRSPYETIYFAFIGNVTDSIFAGYYVNGRFQSFGMTPLKYDASLKSHNYTIKWSSQKIEWYIDTDPNPIQQVNSAVQLPQWPNRFLQNFILDAEDGVNGDWHGLNTNGIYVDRNFSGLADGPVSVNILGRRYIPDVQVACNGSDSVNPGNTNYVDPTECTMDEILLIFQEKMSNSWTTAGSIGTEITSNAKNSQIQVHSGVTSITWVLYPDAGNSMLYFRPPEGEYFTFEDYYAIEFYINGGKSGSQSIQANLILNENGDLSDTVDLLDYTTDGLKAFTWRRIVMPLNSFGNPTPGANDTFHGFVLSVQKYGGTVYVDDVYLIQKYPICDNDTLMIFNDALNQGFNNGSWQEIPGTFNARNTDKVHDGDYSLSWRLNFNSGIKFQIAKGSIPSKYSALSFWMSKGNMTTLQNVVVYMINKDLKTDTQQAGAGPINIQEYFGGVLPYTDWFRVVIPLYEFGITSSTPVHAVALKTTIYDSATYDGIAYIDELELIAETRASDDKKTTGAASGLLYNPFILLVSFLLTVIYML